MNRCLHVQDRGNILTITYEDLIKYHGRYNIAGVALAFTFMELAFQELAPEGIPDREHLQCVTLLGLHGAGVIDALEMATRAKSRGQLRLDTPILGDKPAPPAPEGTGKYYFEISYGGHTLGFALKPGLLPDEFIQLCQKTHRQTITTDEETRLQQVKERLAATIMAAAAEDIFVVYRSDDHTSLTRQ